MIRVPCPKYLSTYRQVCAFKLCWEYEKLSAEYGHSAWADIRIRRLRKEWAYAVHLERARGVA